MKRIPLDSVRDRLAQLVLILSLHGVCANEWKPQPNAFPAPVFSATQNAVLATVSNQVFELAPNDSVWRIKLMSVPGAILAADSFHYLENGSLIDPALQRFPDISSLPDVCCGIRFAEDPERFYLGAGEGNTFYSEKSSPGWKRFHDLPPSAEAYGLMLFPNHYLLIGVDQFSISRDRGVTWEKANGFTGIGGSNHFVKRFGNELFTGFVSSGLFRSKDGGQTWVQVFSNGSPDHYRDFNGMERSGDTIWLSGYDGSKLPEMPDFSWSMGIFRSVDAGKSWEWHHQGLPNQASGTDGKTKEWYPTIGIHRLAGELWTSSVDGNGNGVPYRSRDGGKSWQAVTSGLNPGGSYFPESIGNEIRLRGADDYYRLDKSINQWVVDTLLSPFKIRNIYSVGDTVYGQGGGFFQRKIGPSGQWENLFPSDLQPDVQYYRNGSEFISLTARPVFRLEHSDDGGRTWSSKRPFLPRTRFQERKVEARGTGLYWPDDSLFSPPKLWHAFDDSIRKIWNWQDGILVQSGMRLFHASQSGGAWREISLPDTNLTFVILKDRLTGYSPTQEFTLAGQGSQWASRKLRFPMPRILSLAKSEDYLFYIHNPQIVHDPSSPYSSPRAGYIFKDWAKPSWFTYSNAEISMYPSGSYLFSSLYAPATKRELFDTIGYSQAPTYFFSFAGRGVVNRTTSLITRALFADGDRMAAAYDGGIISFSRDRGKTWNAAGSPLNITGFAGDTNMLFAVADSALHRIDDAGATWTSSGILARNVGKVSGSPAFLAILTQDGRIQVSTDTAKTWTALPALPTGPDDIPTAIAAYDGQVFVGTREYGIFGWGDGKVTSARPGMAPGNAKRPPGNRPGTQAMSSIPRGWFGVPHRPGQITNPKGQWRQMPLSK